MNREEVIEVLTNSLDGLGTAWIVDEAISAAIKLLAADTNVARSPWVKTSDRLPTEADADDEGKVTALITGSITGKLRSLSLYYKSVTAESADYFLPLPKLPEVEE